MKTISPYEASVLSYLARNNQISPAQRNRMIQGLKGEALQIARAMSQAQRRRRTSRSAARTARGLQKWAKRFEVEPAA
jgi:hypothetical protein